jgi:hypothetical protein
MTTIDREKELQRVNELHGPAGIHFHFDRQDVADRVFKVIEDAYHTPRWLDRTFPLLFPIIRKLEMQWRDTITIIDKTQKSLFDLHQTYTIEWWEFIYEDDIQKIIVPYNTPRKAEILKDYSDQLLSVLPNHANVVGHTKRMIYFTERYPDITLIERERILSTLDIFQHDILSESRLCDVTQKEGKTDIFRVKEKYATLAMHDRLYNSDTVSFDKNWIIKNLEDLKKRSDIFNRKNTKQAQACKNRDLLTDVEWFCELHEVWFLKMWQEPFAEKQLATIDNLKKRSWSASYINNFLDDMWARVNNFIQAYTITNQQWDLFDQNLQKIIL